MSLSDKYKVPSNPGFSGILSKPDIRLSKGNFLVVGKQNLEENPRLGISIKKKDYKLSTKRNILKRMVKSSFMRSIKTLPSLDFVVVIGPGETIKNKKTLNEIWFNIGAKSND